MDERDHLSPRQGHSSELGDKVRRSSGFFGADEYRLTAALMVEESLRPK